MNLKAKIHVENQKKTALEKLAARQAILSEKGMDDAAIHRDAVFKKITADIRKARNRLSAIAAQEAQNAERAKAKAEKKAAAKGVSKKSKSATKKPAEGAAKKPKKEKAKIKK